MSVASVVLIVEQLTGGTALLLLVMVTLTVVLARAAAGDVFEPTAETRVSEGEVLGVVVDGEAGPLYGPGRHTVDPTAKDTENDGVGDWRTVRFAAGTTTFAWSHVDETETTDVEVTLTVTDPQCVWQAAHDLDQPLRDVLGQLLDDATAAQPVTALTAQTINDAATVDYGVTVDELSVDVTTRSNAEVDGLDKVA